MTKYETMRHVEPNRHGRDYVVGDVHGHARRLRQLLRWIDFDTECDRLFALGDFIDRGPDSEDALRLSAESWVYGIRGNHEQMMLDALTADGRRRRGQAVSLWQTNGGAWARRLSRETAAALRALAAALPIALTLKTATGSVVGLVHAGVPGGDWTRLSARLAADEAETVAEALWSRDAAYTVMRALRGPSPDVEVPWVSGIDRVYHGHTPMPYPLAAANTRWLDTGVFMADGGLSVAALDDDTVWTWRADAAAPETGWRDVPTVRRDAW
ncbi:metallophosphoesterase [Salinisphaera sp. Q1T1-3]|uniref:metallophosphoesterase n=1 Tax=Salinisphaera sp. Q1T1-3 TaxID=2321229 RepID=UPI000E733221|nr:metallophosphoesterase [Salinisphaera sp. Q1T1-3]RJS94093.1 serine/threonine protein phosphatase [Salinisphaera sp. Q1T1-3]